jgi:hypothetical protein
VRLVLVFCVAVAGCAGDGYGIDLTIAVAPTVSDDTLARVGALEFDVGGAEKDIVTRAPGRALARQERIVYRPKVPAGVIQFTVVARDAQMNAVALGELWVTLKPNVATPATITLNGDLLRTSEPLHDFGPLGLGQLASAKLTLSNLGADATAPLTTMTSGDPFTITDDQCALQMLAAGASCDVTVGFLPVSAGDQAGAIDFGDGTRSAHTDLAGSGVPGMPGSPPVLALTPAVDFGSVAAGGNVAKSVTVSNVGGSTSGALAITQSGDGSVFVIGGNCDGVALPPMGTCSLMLQFAPIAAGKRTSTLTVSDGTVMATSALTGIGTASHHVSVTIVGTGTVSATGLSCTATACSGDYVEGAMAPTLTLSETPDVSTTFSGWSGDCTGTAATCDLTVDRDLAVTATFTIKQIHVTSTVVSKNGKSGSVALSPAGTSCGAGCAAFDYGTQVTISGAPSSGAWLQTLVGGPCFGNIACTVTLTSDVAVTATFNTPANYVFTTSTMYVPGNLGGLAGADAACGQRATAGHWAGHYVALLSTGSTSALSRLGTASGWIRVDGLPFAGTTSTLFSSSNNGVVYYPPRIDETGKDIPAGEVVTGTSVAGAGTAGNDCTGYTVPDANAFVGAGNPDAGAVGWVSTSNRPCSFNTFRLYCFGTDYTATVGAPGTTGRIAFLGSSVFNPSTGVSGANTICKNDATAAGLSGNFAALLSTSTVAAALGFSATGANWVRRDGVQVAASPAALLQGTLTAPIAQLANGTYAGYGLGVWTGSTAPNILGGAYTCNDWTNATASYDGMYGTMDSGPSWFSSYHTGCGSPTWTVYCLQQ